MPLQDHPTTPPAATAAAPGRRILVTGGAGFVGSHVSQALVARGDRVTVLDDLSQGHRGAVPSGAQFVKLNLAGQDAVDELLAAGPWHAVMHFAALSLVGESMADPFRYLLGNAGQGMGLIDGCIRHGIKRFVLSSTANIYGEPDAVPIVEDAAARPSSPYGESKLVLERALRWADQIHGLRYACLRYFNAAGADPGGLLGEDHHPETHLIPLTIDAALGRRPPLIVFGNDYPTPDGTAVRDYVHVADLASAHLLALDRLDGGSMTLNVGTGTGYSVLEVAAAVERVSGRSVPMTVGPRRPGDPAILVAAPDLIRRTLGWQPRFSELDTLVSTALAWRSAHPDGFGDRILPVYSAAD